MFTLVVSRSLRRSAAWAVFLLMVVLLVGVAGGVPVQAQGRVLPAPGTEPGQQAGLAGVATDRLLLRVALVAGHFDHHDEPAGAQEVLGLAFAPPKPTKGDALALLELGARATGVVAEVMALPRPAALVAQTITPTYSGALQTEVRIDPAVAAGVPGGGAEGDGPPPGPEEAGGVPDEAAARTLVLRVVNLKEGRPTSDGLLLQTDLPRSFVGPLVLGSLSVGPQTLFVVAEPVRPQGR